MFVVAVVGVGGLITTTPPNSILNTKLLPTTDKLHRLHLILRIQFVAVFAGGKFVGLLFGVFRVDHEVLELGEDVGGLFYLPFGEQAGLLLKIFLHLINIGDFKRQRLHMFDSPNSEKPLRQQV